MHYFFINKKGRGLLLLNKKRIVASETKGWCTDKKGRSSDLEIVQDFTGRKKTCSISVI